VSSHVFKIQNGVLAFTLVDTAAVGYLPEWQTPGGIAVDTITLAAYTTANGLDFSCSVTSGALTASPNTTDDTTPATFCEPEVTETTVGVTSFTLDATILQDPDLDAASAYAYEHDTEEVYFLLGLDGVNPPKAAGRCRMVAGAFGGDARVTLTADLSLPVTRKPDIEFGNATTSRVVWGSGAAPVAPGGLAAAGAKTTTKTSDATTTS